MKPNLISARAALRKRYQHVLTRLFIPCPLVRPGWSVEGDSELRNDFEKATISFRKRRFQEATERFLTVERIAESSRPGSGRTALFNAAASAAAAAEDDLVIDLLLPLYERQLLYGLPLWNVALALYRKGRTREAVAALEQWITSAPNDRGAQGRIVLAALGSFLEDKQVESTNLEAAIKENANLVNQLLQLSDSQKRTTGWHTDLDARAQDQLIKLLSPRRPDRTPSILSYLPPEDVQRFEQALELMAEGEHYTAIEIFSSLREEHGDQATLEAALGASLLFTGDIARARDLLSLSTETARPTGTTLWNLACAHARLGELDLTCRTLQECAKTEYRTSPTLLAVLNLFRDRPSILSLEAPERPPSGGGLEDLILNLPAGVADRRETIMSRLLVAKRLPKSFQPDRLELRQKDRKRLAKALASARALPPAGAVDYLRPLIDEYRSSYSLRVHSAAHALTDGSPQFLQEAVSLLSDAERLRNNLDMDSRLNLAHAYLRRNDFRGVLAVLERGTETPAAKSRWVFWLALSLAQAKVGAGDYAHTAAKAVASLGQTPQAIMIRRVLRAANIEPSEIVEEGTTLRRAAHRALEALSLDNVTDAVDALREAWDGRAESVPEIRDAALSPRHMRRPADVWPDAEKQAFERAVQLLETGQYSEAAVSFEWSFKKYRRVSPALNAMAARIHAQEYKQAIKICRPWLLRPFYSHAVRERLIHTLALAHFLAGDRRKARQLIRQFLSRGGSRPRQSLRPHTALLAAACLPSTNDPGEPEVFVEVLAGWDTAGGAPSEELLVALASARLTFEKTDIQGARKALHLLIEERRGPVGLQSPNSIATVSELKNAYAHLRNSHHLAEAVTYLQSVATTAPGKDARPIAVRVVAQRLLVEALWQLDQQEEAIEQLDEAEAFLTENRSEMGPGLEALNWHGFVELALHLQFPWAARRYRDYGLRADSSSEPLKRISEELDQVESSLSQTELERAASALYIAANTTDGSGRLELDALRASFNRAGTEWQRVPVLYRIVDELLDRLLSHQATPTLVEDLVERAGRVAKILLPEQARSELQKALSQVSDSWGIAGQRAELEIEVYDDLVWPREDDREACCTLRITLMRGGDQVRLVDATSDTVIWDGALGTDENAWVRWLIWSEDGFVPDDTANLQLTRLRLRPTSVYAFHFGVSWKKRNKLQESTDAEALRPFTKDRRSPLGAQEHLLLSSQPRRQKTSSVAGGLKGRDPEPARSYRLPGPGRSCRGRAGSRLDS